MTKTALITGVSGQDGAYLSQFLLDKGYKVYGAVRRTSSSDYWRLRELNIEQDVELLYLDLIEESNIIRTIGKLKVDEIYNLAAQSFVSSSFEQPIYTSQINGVGVCRLLEAVRLNCAGTKFYQASTSEMYGKARAIPQTETTPFYPRSPYGIAKLYAHWTTVNYREAYGIFACSGILFNHESPLRGPEFVTRKITLSLAEIRHQRRDVVKLGNLNAKRDWGFAGDYVKGMWAMLQAARPDDYVLATGETRTVREFVSQAAASLGFDLEWTGERDHERAIDRSTGRMIVEVEPQLYRPAEVDIILGSADKAKRELGWVPRVGFADLVERMARSDHDRVAKL